jgi:hypothetical protein
MDANRLTRPAKLAPPRPTHAWWPVDLGTPTTSGSTERLRYAYFPAKRRLVLERAGVITIYDTGQHQFRGALQSTGADCGSLTFLTQHARVALDTLPVIAPAS